MKESFRFRSARLKRLKQRMLVSRDTDTSGIISDNGNAHSLKNNYSKTGNDQSSEKQGIISGNESSRSRNECNERRIQGMIRISDLPMIHNQWLSNTTSDLSYMCNNEFKNDQNANDHKDERVVFANLIENLKLDIDENKNIQKKLRKPNASLTHEMNECKCTLTESNDIRDRCRSSLNDQDIKLERPSFANPKYLKKAQSKKPCVYKILYGKDDLANIFAPNHEETLTLEQESRSKLHKKHIETMKGKDVDTNFGKPSVLGKPPLQPLRYQLVVRQPIAFKYKRSSFSKHRFASQVVKKNDFIKPITLYSWPKVRQSAIAKPYHVDAPGPSRKSIKRVSFQSPKESIGSNDMVHNYYLEEAKKNAKL
nr:hypothetical protein [Tanacetum cinerariifolium]